MKYSKRIIAFVLLLSLLLPYFGDLSLANGEEVVNEEVMVETTIDESLVNETPLETEISVTSEDELVESEVIQEEVQSEETTQTTEEESFIDSEKVELDETKEDTIETLEEETQLTTDEVVEEKNEDITDQMPETSGEMETQEVTEVKELDEVTEEVSNEVIEEVTDEVNNEVDIQVIEQPVDNEVLNVAAFEGINFEVRNVNKPSIGPYYVGLPENGFLSSEKMVGELVINGASLADNKLLAFVDITVPLEAVATFNVAFANIVDRSEDIKTDTTWTKRIYLKEIISTFNGTVNFELQFVTRVLERGYEFKPEVKLYQQATLDGEQPIFIKEPDNKDADDYATFILKYKEQLLFKV